MGEGMPKKEDQFTPGKYLSPSQIDIIKSQAQNVMDPVHQPRLIQLIDGFVESNGTRTPEYSRLMEAMKVSGELLSPALRYPLDVQQNLPFLYYLAYYDYLILVGVLTVEDVMRVQSQFADVLSGKKDKLPQA